MKSSADSLVVEDSYWPGFSTENVPLFMYLNGESWLIDHPYPPTDWSPVDRWEGFFHSNTISPPVKESRLIKHGGTPTAYIYEDSSAQDSLNGHIAQFIGQSFRQFSQIHYPDWKSHDHDAFLFSYGDRDLLKWQMLESEGLQEASKALAKNNQDDALYWMIIAAKARTNFITDATELDHDYVRSLELEYGLPLYMESKARKTPPFMLYHNDMWSGVLEVRQRAAVNAAVKAFLLDEYYSDWKTTAAFHAAPDLDLNHLLNKAVERAGADMMPIPNDLVLEYERRAGSNIYQFHSEQRSMLRHWEKEPGYRIYLEASSSPMIATGFDLAEVIRLDDDRMFHEHWLKLRNNNGVVEIRNQRVLTWPAGDHPLFDGIHRVEIVGIGTPPVAEERGDSLIVRWTDGEMMLKGAQMEEWEGVVMITL